MKKGGQKSRKKNKKYKEPIDTTTDDSEADTKPPPKKKKNKKYKEPVDTATDDSEPDTKPPPKKKKNKLFEEELQIVVKHEGVERDVRKLIMDGYFWGYYTPESLENIQTRMEESENLEAQKTMLIDQFKSEKQEFQSKLLVQFEEAKSQLDEQFLANEMRKSNLAQENEILVQKNAALTLQLKEQIEVNKSLLVTSMKHMELLFEKWTEEEAMPTRKRRREIPGQEEPINIDSNYY